MSGSPASMDATAVQPALAAQELGGPVAGGRGLDGHRRRHLR
jgi:hypothetical protein